MISRPRGWKDPVHLWHLRASQPGITAAQRRIAKKASAKATLGGKKVKKAAPQAKVTRPSPEAPARPEAWRSARVFWLAARERESRETKLGQAVVRAHLQRLPRGYKDSAHEHALRQSNPGKGSFLAPTVHLAIYSEKRPFLSEQHHACLRESDPCLLLQRRNHFGTIGAPNKSLQGSPRMAPRGCKGQKTAEHLTHLVLSEPSLAPPPPSRTSNTGVRWQPWLAWAERILARPAAKPAAPHRKSRDEKRVPRRPRGWKSPQHLINIGMSNPTWKPMEERAGDFAGWNTKERRRRGWKDPVHMCHLAESDPAGPLNVLPPQLSTARGRSAKRAKRSNRSKQPKPTVEGAKMVRFAPARKTRTGLVRVPESHISRQGASLRGFPREELLPQAITEAFDVVYEHDLRRQEEAITAAFDALYHHESPHEGPSRSPTHSMLGAGWLAASAEHRASQKTGCVLASDWAAAQQRKQTYIHDSVSLNGVPRPPQVPYRPYDLDTAAAFGVPKKGLEKALAASRSNRDRIGVDTSQLGVPAVPGKHLRYNSSRLYWAVQATGEAYGVMPYKPYGIDTSTMPRPELPKLACGRGKYPLISSRVYHTAMGKKHNAGAAVYKCHTAMLPRGHKDATHLENLRVSEPGLKEYIVQRHRPRGWKDSAHRRALSRSDPQKPKKNASVKASKPPSIQTIMAAIIQQEVTRIHAPSSPRSPRHGPDMGKVLGISETQVSEIKSQGSPRLRAKAVGAAILNMRLPSSCARGVNDVSNKRFSSRQTYGF